MTAFRIIIAGTLRPYLFNRRSIRDGVHTAKIRSSPTTELDNKNDWIISPAQVEDLLSTRAVDRAESSFIDDSKFASFDVFPYFGTILS